MGFFSHKIQRSELRSGDHIYTYRFFAKYTHHGIYVADDKIIHFLHINPEKEMCNLPHNCPKYPDCGYRILGSRVFNSCVDCFLKNGSLFRYEYGTSPAVFLTKLRGGTCTTATSDAPGTVVERATYLLQTGFGDYDLSQNNCEDFSLYCKTGKLIIRRSGVGANGQATSIICGVMAAFASFRLKSFIPSLGVATVAAGLYLVSRYSADIGVRDDAVKVALEDLDVNSGVLDRHQENSQVNESFKPDPDREQD